MPANILATILCLTLAFLAPPAGAQFWRSTGLPDPVEFGLRIEEGDLAQARAWLDRGLAPDFVADRVGTGLMIAAWQGNLPMMELFVTRGAEVNRTNALGEDAIMHAAWRGRLDAVKWLLERGATLNRGGRRWTALHYAAFSGQEEVTGFLVEKGADINAQSTNGSSPLMMAVYEGREAVVGQLVRLCADRSIRNDHGEGALDWAFKHDRLAIARLVGSTEEFSTAANRPKAQWAETTRSLPATATEPAAQVKTVSPRQEAERRMRAEIAHLTRVRATLAARGLDKDTQKLDRKIAGLRFKLAKPGEDYRRPAVLEISASRKSPREQNTRLIREPAAGK